MRYAVMNDVNGDGIPDGADVTIKFKKGQGNAELGTRKAEVVQSRPVMNEGFDAARDKAADMYGIRRTNTAARPVMQEDTISYLNKRSQDNSVSVAGRNGARRQLEDITTMLDRAAGRQSQERMAQSEAQAMADKARIPAEAKVQAAGINAGAEVQGKQITADATVAAAEARARAQEARDAAHRQMLQDSRAEREAARNVTRTDQRQRWVNGALDKEYSPNGLTKETLRGYLVRTRDEQGNVKPDAKQDPVWESRLDSVEQQAEAWNLPLFGPKAGEVHTAPKADPQTDAVPVFDSEAAARAAGKGPGDVVYIRGMGKGKLK